MTTEKTGTGAANSEAGSGVGSTVGKTAEETAAAEKAGKGSSTAGAGAGAGADGKGKEAGAGGDAEKVAADAAAAKAAAEAAKKAPEKYTLTLPEKGHILEEDLGTIEEVARKNNWTNDEAQAALEEHNAQLAAQSEKWMAETKVDKDLGGAKLEQTQLQTKAAIDFLFPKGDPYREGFINFLNRGGAGNNINVVRALVRIGKHQAEDGNVSGSGSGSGGGGQQKSAEDVLYKPTTAST